MLEVYDYDNAHLFLGIGGGFKYDLQIKPPFTGISGYSATGKTLLAKSIIRYNALANKESQSTNIHAFLRGMEIRDIEDLDKCLIVMDEADKYMTQELCDYINCDMNNHYLFMARVNIGVDISPNYWGDFYTDGNKIIRIKYEAR